MTLCIRDFVKPNMRGDSNNLFRCHVCGQSLLKREAWVTLYTLRIDPPHAAPCGSDMKNHAGEWTGKNNIRLSMFVITSPFTGGWGDAGDGINKIPHDVIIKM